VADESRAAHIARENGAFEIRGLVANDRPIIQVPEAAAFEPVDHPVDFSAPTQAEVDGAASRVVAEHRRRGSAIDIHAAIGMRVGEIDARKAWLTVVTVCVTGCAITLGAPCGGGGPGCAEGVAGGLLRRGRGAVLRLAAGAGGGGTAAVRAGAGVARFAGIGVTKTCGSGVEGPLAPGRPEELGALG
jgi:hypothetical protein